MVGGGAEGGREGAWQRGDDKRLLHRGGGAFHGGAVVTTGWRGNGQGPRPGVCDEGVFTRGVKNGPDPAGGAWPGGFSTRAWQGGLVAGGGLRQGAVLWGVWHGNGPGLVRQFPGLCKWA